jgi:hypothetical protein
MHKIQITPIQIFKVIVFSLFGYISAQVLVEYNLQPTPKEKYPYSTYWEKIALEDSIRTANPSADQALLNKEFDIFLNKKYTQPINSKWQEIIECRNITFNVLPIFLVWTILIGIMWAVSFAVIPIFIFLKEKLEAADIIKIKFHRPSFFFTAIIFILLICPLVFPKGILLPVEIICSTKVLLCTPWVVPLFVFITMLASSGLVYILFVVAEGVNQCQLQFQTLSIEQLVAKAKCLKFVFNVSLTFLATTVIMTVLTSSALGESIRGALVVRGFAIFPNNASYVYGLNFSVFLALIYLPINYSCQQFYQKLKSESLLKSDLPDALKTEIDELISNNANIWDKGKSVLIVISPFLSALLPELTRFFQ